MELDPFWEVNNRGKDERGELEGGGGEGEGEEERRKRRIEKVKLRKAEVG